MEKAGKADENEGYIPLAPDEEYMNSRQLKYFKNELLEWKSELKKESMETVEQLRNTPLNEPDPIDQANTSTATSLELRTQG